jgi:hypothetical protein
VREGEYLAVDRVLPFRPFPVLPSVRRSLLHIARVAQRRVIRFDQVKVKFLARLRVFVQVVVFRKQPADLLLVGVAFLCILINTYSKYKFESLTDVVEGYPPVPQPLQLLLHLL